MPGQMPSFVSTSLWQTPQACTLMRTCPASGSGISRSTISKSAPGFGTCTAFIGFTATLVVAIIPPWKFPELLKTIHGSRRNGQLRTDKPLSCDLENHFQFDGRAERKACDAEHQAAGALFFSEDVLQQLRSGVGNFRQVADVSGSGQEHTEPDDACDFVERSQMLSRHRKGVKRREVCRGTSRVFIELCAEAPDKFRRASFGGKHSRQKKQVAGLHRFHVGAERFRRGGQLDAKFLQPLLGANRLRALPWGYHLPKCAPPSTCSTSPVT